MRKGKICLLLSFFLVSCGGGTQSNSVASGGGNSPSVEPELTEIEKVIRLKERLLQFGEDPAKKIYSMEQEDSYGITINSLENGTTIRYQDSFIVSEFQQKIGDGEMTNGRKEIGIAGENIYEILFFGAQEKDNNSVKYYVDNEENRAALLPIGFASEYIRDILNVTIAYFEQEDLKLSLLTNYSDIDWETDGEKTLSYRFINFAANGINKLEEVERDDKIVIEDGQIVSCETEMLYSLQNGVNYHYLKKNQDYFYEDLLPFEGEKLNPSDYEKSAS